MSRRREVRLAKQNIKDIRHQRWTKTGMRANRLLFITFVDQIIKNVNSKAKHGIQRIQKIKITECAFYDEEVIMIKNEADLQKSPTTQTKTLQIQYEDKHRKDHSDDGRQMKFSFLK